MIDTTVLLGVGMFTATVLSLVLVILSARSRLVSSGNVTIQINDDPAKAIEVPAGGKLLSTLASRSPMLCFRHTRAVERTQSHSSWFIEI